jgi:hypothetical protein
LILKRRMRARRRVRRVIGKIFQMKPILKMAQMMMMVREGGRMEARARGRMMAIERLVRRGRECVVAAVVLREMLSGDTDTLIFGFVEEMGRAEQTMESL